MTGSTVPPQCTGACCAVFWLPYTPENLRKRAAEANAGSDLPYIADMVISLSPRKARKRATEFGLDWPKLKIGDDNADQVYTCRHWDEGSRRCSAYETRPRLCRDYPYEGECRHCGFRETDAVQAEWRKIRNQEFVWSKWRWNRKLRGYQAKSDPPHVDWSPGDHWRWDGTLLRPESDDWRWDPKRRKWRAKA